MEDKNAPATKGDLADLKTEVRTEMHEGFAQLRSEMGDGFAQLRSEMSHNYNDLVEMFRDGQTELLKAFYSYAEGSNKRISELEERDAPIKRRLAGMEDRLLEIERRLNMPPAA